MTALRAIAYSDARERSIVSDFFATVAEHMAGLATMELKDLAMQTGPGNRLSVHTPPIWMTMTLKLAGEVIDWQQNRLFTAPKALALINLSVESEDRLEAAISEFFDLARNHRMPTGQRASVHILEGHHAPFPREMFRGGIKFRDQGVSRQYQFLGWIELTTEEVGS